MRTTILCALAGVLLLGSGAARAEGSVESAFDDAYRSVKSGVKKTVRAGDRLFSRAADGAVSVSRDAQNATGMAASVTTDALITTKIRSKLIVDDLVRAGDINVDTDAGVVTLRGAVRTPAEAERAIDLALQTDGVARVVSRLDWPSRAERQQR